MGAVMAPWTSTGLYWGVKMRRFTRIATLATSFALMTSGPAIAAAPPNATAATPGSVTAPSAVTTVVDPTADPKIQQYLSTLSPAEAKTFKDTKLIASWTTTTLPPQPLDAAAQSSAAAAASSGQAVAAYASGCWQNRTTREARSPIGLKVVSIFMAGQSCSNGSRITSSGVFEAGGQTHVIGWRYNGVINKWSGFSPVEGRSSAQFSFTLGSGGWDFQSPTPCIRVYQNIDRRTANNNLCGVS